MTHLLAGQQMLPEAHAPFNLQTQAAGFSRAQLSWTHQHWALPTRADKVPAAPQANEVPVSVWCWVASAQQVALSASGATLLWGEEGHDRRQA